MEEIIKTLRTKINQCEIEGNRFNKSTNRILFMQELFSYLAKKYDVIPTDDDLSEVADLVRRADVANGAVTVSVKTALQISDALEQLKYPPIVRMTLAFLETYKSSFDWLAIDRCGYVYEYFSRPKLHEEMGIWSSGEDSLRVPDLKIYRQPEYFTLLFHRGENGVWKWIGKDHYESLKRPVNK